MLEESALATVALLMVTASFPFYLKGAAVVLNAEFVSWAVLTRHLKFIATGLALTTVPVVTWMGPRLLDQLGGLAALHAFFGLQAYALLAFALTGIVRVFQTKREANVYRDPDPDAALDDLHPDMSAWRARIRIGVFGYVVFWLLAYVVGVARFVLLYL